jgi:hypothetical protein
MSRSHVVNLVGFAHAENFQNALGIDGYQYGPRGSASRSTQRPVSNASFGRSPSALAQVHGWDTPFAADNFQTVPTLAAASVRLHRSLSL